MAKYSTSAKGRPQSKNIEDRRKTDNRARVGNRQDSFFGGKGKSVDKGSNSKGNATARRKENVKQSYAGNDGINRRKPSKSKNNSGPDRESFLTFKGRRQKTKENK